MHRRLALISILGWVWLLFLGTSGISLKADPPAEVLAVTGEVAKPRTWTLAQLAELPHEDVKVEDKTGPVTYSAVRLAKVLEASQVPQGETLRGAALSLVLVVKAADQYQAVFSLAELDPATVDKAVWLADRMNGQPIPEGFGPLRLVVPDEKRHARWVRMVNRLEVVAIPGARAAKESKDGK